MRHTTLKAARTRRRMDQVTLAQRSGLNQGTVSRLETGRIAKPTPETVQKLEQALALRPGSLRFTDTEVSA